MVCLRTLISWSVASFPGPSFSFNWDGEKLCPPSQLKEKLGPGNEATLRVIEESSAVKTILTVSYMYLSCMHFWWNYLQNV